MHNQNSPVELLISNVMVLGSGPIQGFVPSIMLSIRDSVVDKKNTALDHRHHYSMGKLG